MASRFVTKLLACTVLAIPLSTLPTAAAQPGNGPLIHTTCSYDQLYAAIRVEGPQAAAELDSRPAAQQKLQRLAAMSVEERKQEWARMLAENPQRQARIDEKWGTPEGQEKAQRMARIAETCHNY
ncbi:hemophore-related protein [Mycolicibacterium pyrenivorans]|uniref:hemophore-related protein n=1 Tax=Mycolicibacterium pyrenivorans TaxID=187102 RepID=UPI0021F273FA|nr:hemophore-related protein [Mycolicibacterium pyrenivorans]MCV7154532.1 hemophore-related protein [Mycolicibacterium pyrenivorans]